jgi:uncharacterized membrane protein YfcA
VSHPQLIGARQDLRLDERTKVPISPAPDEPSQSNRGQAVTTCLSNTSSVAAVTGMQIAIIIGLTMAGSVVHALVAIDPAFAPGPLLLAGQVVGIRHVLVEHGQADFRAWKRGLCGVPVGVVGALLVLEMMSDKLLAITVGSLTAAAAAMLLTGRNLSRTPRSETVAGAVCAFSSLTAALPGPPLVCVYSDMKPSVMRPTASLLILSVASVGFITLLATGNFDSEEFALLAWLMPGVVAGLIASRWVRPHLDQPWFRSLVLTIALIGGLALVGRQLFS